MKSRIMYIERKAGKLMGEAQIEHVTFSESGCKMYCKGLSFRSLKGSGFTSNYFDVDSSENYWISGPLKDGADRPYCEPAPVEIDEVVRKDYWISVRCLPYRLRQSSNF